MGRQTTVRWQKQVFVHTWLLRAHFALARLSCNFCQNWNSVVKFAIFWEHSVMLRTPVESCSCFQSWFLKMPLNPNHPSIDPLHWEVLSVEAVEVISDDVQNYEWNPVANYYPVWSQIHTHTSLVTGRIDCNKWSLIVSLLSCSTTSLILSFCCDT